MVRKLHNSKLVDFNKNHQSNQNHQSATVNFFFLSFCYTKMSKNETKVIIPGKTSLKLGVSIENFEL